MKIVFVSNYYNHHQSALSAGLYSRTESSYRFIATSEMRPERRALGYGQGETPDFVLKAHGDPAEKRCCEALIEGADVVIAGSAPESLLHSRIQSGKLFFRYAERPLRRGAEPLKYLPRLIRWHLRNPMTKPLYLLCASAYTAGDYARFGLYRNRAYKWGYFTETKIYEDPEKRFAEKNRKKILWVARFLPLKHPEHVIQVAARLKEEGYEFDLDLIGSGEMEPQLRQMIDNCRLENHVHLLGTMKPEAVREHMEKAGIFLFTSDKREGWGAVLNEAMNSGCAVVASHAIGSVPYLIRDGENGLIYRSGDVDMLYEKVKHLLESPDTQQRLGNRAYETITQTWNAEVAAERLVELSARILAGEKYPDLYESGPCSRSPIMKDDWM